MTPPPWVYTKRSFTQPLSGKPWRSGCRKAKMSARYVPSISYRSRSTCPTRVPLVPSKICRAGAKDETSKIGVSLVFAMSAASVEFGNPLLMEISDSEISSSPYAFRVATRFSAIAVSCLSPSAGATTALLTIAGNATREMMCTTAQRAKPIVANFVWRVTIA